MLKKTVVVMLVLFATMICIQCKEKSQVKGITLEVTFSEEELSDDLITDVQYAWKTDSNFVKIEQEMHVYVHFWHKNNLLFQDDHIPDPPITEWDVDQEHVYTRRVYIPEFIDEFDPEFKGEETLRLVVGISSPFDRKGDTKQQIFETKLKVLPPPLDTPEKIYEDGWYDLEINPDSFLKQWRWTAKEARCIIDNPRRDALLVIKGGVNLDALEDQKVIIKINDRIFDEFIPEESYFEKSYNIKKEMVGEGEQFFLVIATDKVFVPAEIFPNSKDMRELGLQISFVYYR
jgi:hypothetical protein